MFDDERRAWIADHQGWSRIQTRRAELLARQIRRRVREQTGARPNPHEDTVIQPIWARTGPAPALTVEGAAVLMCLCAAPIGWLAGYCLHKGLVSQIPRRIVSYPITALVWSAVAVGLPILLLVGSGMSPVGVYLLVQLPAMFFAAGIYGVLEGWLSVPGSTDLWPHVPEDPPVQLPELLGADDITPPVLLEYRRGESGRGGN
ncbi:hypothetical protein P0W64_16495 [Tsukamurella sp. 8F]|uniref:hypothetical protein n=1 Tax=unclassified Tsukamurella TaxID=2633480 RepID=UPI0023B8989C|nr:MULTISPECIES: hypothetical protein [unclassified Tsukamurella]MDF0531135.1 hypothetical protein [Tsukamurella sp. 8J]MDF0588381.1 hypothetical protein [Tsukamurella sp. 8F]